VKPLGRGRHSEDEAGQIVILLALSMTVLLLSVALSVDVGLAYVTKAKLSKAVDAACLTAMKNLAQGQSTARTLATNSFNVNYAASDLDASPPSLAINFSTDGYGQTLVNVSATATVQTFFVRILPQFETWQVSDSAQATRGKLIMSVVLDRSGSMKNNGGSSALPPAVTSFINYFDNTNDEVAMVSFASNATVDVAMNYNFITPITNAVKAMSFTGGTFGLGGLIQAQAQNDSVVVQTGQNAIKVAVYFTDGFVNTLQDTFACTSQWGNTLYNYGGWDADNCGYGSRPCVDFFNPSTGADLANKDYSSGVDKNGNPGHQPTPDCTGVTQFTSQQTGKLTTFSRTAVTADAQYRSLQTASAMRAEGMIIYSIGLGNSVDQSFLRQIANDPASSTYNPNQPAGLAVFAPNCPSSQCSAQLQQVFQTIAAKILLRLTQ
jgi:Flp pilus assembly protein TadG